MDAKSIEELHQWRSVVIGIVRSLIRYIRCGQRRSTGEELAKSAVVELVSLWERGAFTPLVGAELPLDEVEHAHELVESRRSVGKVVLLP